MRYKLIVLLMSILFIFTTLADSKVKYYSLVEKIRLSTAIINGDVVEIGEYSVRILVKEVIKGHIDEETINVILYKDAEPHLTYNLNERALLFLQEEQGGVYELVGRSQGKADFDFQEADLYKQTIRKVVEFDSTEDPSEKTKMLIELMNFEIRLSKMAVLEIIYFESNKGKFLTEPLIPVVVSRTTDQDVSIAVQAVFALGRIGDTSSIQVLIGLLRSEHDQVERAASKVLKNMTNKDFGYDVKLPHNEKEIIIQKWELWLEENRETLKVIR